MIFEVKALRDWKTAEKVYFTYKQKKINRHWKYAQTHHIQLSDVDAWVLAELSSRFWWASKMPFFISSQLSSNRWSVAINFPSLTHSLTILLMVLLCLPLQTQLTSIQLSASHIFTQFVFCESHFVFKNSSCVPCIFNTHNDLFWLMCSAVQAFKITKHI